MTAEFADLTLEQQVAQRFIVGFQGFQGFLNPTNSQRFARVGVGGWIFFRENFEDPETGQYLSPLQIANRNAQLLNQTQTAGLPWPFLAIDQEGGLIERLPHTAFPSLPSPGAISLSQNPTRAAQHAYGILAQNLALLGFNMNCFPTLDVNLNPQNPIIGIRAFGHCPKQVWQLAQIALQTQQAAGIVSVGKHFPGHGNGTVDSHVALPVLTFTPDELSVFQEAIQAHIPAMMVAHGLYPALQDPTTEKTLPASASPTIIQQLLRQRLGFEGLIITDDMVMGAISQYQDPVEAALLSIEAGADILLYKDSDETQWVVFQAVVQALKAGKLSLNTHQAAVDRILKAKQAYLKPLILDESRIQAELSTAACMQQADKLAEEALAEEALKETLSVHALGPQPNRRLPLPFDMSFTTPIILIYPDRQRLRRYQADAWHSPELPEVLMQAGFKRVKAFAYGLNSPASFSSSESLSDRLQNWLKTLPTTADTVGLLVTYNPDQHREQLALINTWQHVLPSRPLLLAHADLPPAAELLTGIQAQGSLQLPSYRPAAMRALAKRLLS